MAKIQLAVWNDAIGYVRIHYPDLVRGWFIQLQPASLEGGTLTVRARNSLQEEYLRQHCQRAFSEALQAATGRLLCLEFESLVGLDESLEETPPALSFESDSGLTLNRDYTFENFITGPSNRLAHAAAVAVSEAPGKSYNPLFVHGPVGLGKTHLLQAVCHTLTETKKEPVILYISCETFTNHFFEAVEKGALNQFRYRYRHVDVLVIDDIQFLAERERSQEEFFHTFNTLHQSQKQVILSADCSPPEIPSLQERLISRFNSGLVAMIDRPCLETRMAIVRKKAKLRGMDIGEDVIRLVASSIEANIRELEGALAKIDAMSLTRQGEVNLELAFEALGVDQGRRGVTIPDILETVGRRYNVRQSDLQGKRRTQSVARPRQICMYLARQLTNLSLGEIGGYLGGRDHTTVLHAHRQIADRVRLDNEFGHELEDLKGQLLHRARVVR